MRTQRLAIPDIVSNSYFPAIAAVELGCFGDQGIDIEVFPVSPVNNALELLRDGEVDLVAGSGHSVPAIFQEWRGARLLCALSQGTYWCLVAKSELGIRDGEVDRLRGLVIGASPLIAPVLKRITRYYGLNPDEGDFELVDVNRARNPGVPSFGFSAVEALRLGEIDGFWANRLSAALAVESGVGRIVLDARKVDAHPRVRYLSVPALIGTSDRLQHDVDFCRASVRAVMAAQQKLRRDPALALPASARWFPTTLSTLNETVVRNDSNSYSPNLDKEYVLEMLKFSRWCGLLHAVVDYDEVVASQCIPVWRELA